MPTPKSISLSFRGRSAAAYPSNGGASGFLPRSPPTMQPSVRVRASFELGLDICAFLFLPILVLASRGTAPLAGAAGLCALGLVVDNLSAAWWRVHRLAPFFAALVLWGLLSSLWALEPPRSLLIALRLSGLFAAGLALMAASSEIR